MSADFYMKLPRTDVKVPSYRVALLVETDRGCARHAGDVRERDTIRVQITAPEVETLNAIYEKYVGEYRSDLGFGWHLLQQAHTETVEAPTVGVEPAPGPDQAELAGDEDGEEDSDA
ncbi:hypothetical protein ACWD4J_18395 [Streptomyces sp. NPDC002577]